MKKINLFLTLAAISCAGCRCDKTQNDIVKETYVHKYGVPITQSDWEKRGENGQKISLRNDGVTITTSYSKGVLHGPTTLTYPNSSTIKRCETYSEGTLIAEKENYPSGMPMVERIYDKGLLTQLTWWYEEGTPQAYEIYHDSILVSGEYRTQLNVVETRVVEGNGTRISRSNEGRLLTKDTVQNGQMVERIAYSPHGEPTSITPYENGKIHGTRLTFQPGGLPNTVEEWVAGYQEGTTLVYQNGEKIAEVTYHHGKKNGVESRYRDGNILVEQISWKEDIQHGPRNLYIDGEPTTEWYYIGELVSHPVYDTLPPPQQWTR